MERKFPSGARKKIASLFKALARKKIAASPPSPPRPHTDPKKGVEGVGGWGGVGDKQTNCLSFSVLYTEWW